MSYESYNAYDKLTQPSDALLDVDILASEGVNPFVEPGESGGTYRISVVADEAPPERPKNTLYLGSKEQRCIQGPGYRTPSASVAGTRPKQSGFYANTLNEYISAYYVHDSHVVLDEQRNYTIVVSRAGNRPANARPECGVIWPDRG